MEFQGTYINLIRYNDAPTYNELNALKTIFQNRFGDAVRKAVLQGMNQEQIKQHIHNLYNRFLQENRHFITKLFGQNELYKVVLREWAQQLFPDTATFLLSHPDFQIKQYIDPQTLQQLKEVANYQYKSPKQQQKTNNPQQGQQTSQPSTQPTPQPQPQPMEWQLPEEGLLLTGEFATQLAKRRQQQEANLLASGLSRQQILQQRGSEDIIRELGLSKMIAEQRRKAIQDWLQTVSGLQQQVRPPDFTGLREMAMAYQQATSAQQQMMMKLFENLMKQGG